MTYLISISPDFCGIFLIVQKEPTEIDLHQIKEKGRDLSDFTRNHHTGTEIYP